MFISLEGVNHLLFAAYYRAEDENKAKTRVILKKTLEVDVNDNYICFSLKNSNFNKDSSFSKDKNSNYWKNIANDFQKRT